MTKHLLSVFDLNKAEIWSIIKSAIALKKSGKSSKVLAGYALGMIFEKPSTRTSVSFAVAMDQLGGMPLMLDAKNLQRKRGETIKDTAYTLSRYLDGMMIRAFKHSDVQEFAKWSSVPIINGLTDREHPCQVFGDILTIVEKRKIKTIDGLKQIKVAFVGDGNNMANSWCAAAGVLGFSLYLARPKGYGPNKEILEHSLMEAKKSGGKVEVLESAQDAVKNADVIYTDVWTSMGEEDEAEERRIIFKSYQINSKLLSLAKANCLVMHCLPAIRGEEITSDVMDGKNSVIFDQAENRLHIQKAILKHYLK